MIDDILVDYLKSGNACLLIGSGPSIQMGYPTWQELAKKALTTAKQESEEKDFGAMEDAIGRGDYPRVFEEAKRLLGAKRLLKCLEESMCPKRDGEIYKLLAQWPIPIYLTTNYDDEIQKQLAKVGEAYLPFNNSADHMSHLLPDFAGGIFKLHGDLKSEQGLILTTSEYKDIHFGDGWAYWRTKMTSICQTMPMIIVGHSLSDPNIRHVLEVAQKGSGAVRPVCWIAPDVSISQRREYLDKYRIRVITYSNRDGEHRNLLTLIKTLSQFIPPRTSITASPGLVKKVKDNLGKEIAAPGFYVFNKMLGAADYDKKREDILFAIIQSVVPLFGDREFTVSQAFESAGWPADNMLPVELQNELLRKLADQGIVEATTKTKCRFTARALRENRVTQDEFLHLKKRFTLAVELRIRRDFPEIGETLKMAENIEASLALYFREGGLSLSTKLFDTHDSSVPMSQSVAKFINERCVIYDDALSRQAFSAVSLSLFTQPELLEKEYLGRISQGYFAFHALGVFGDVAVERLKHAREVVWIVDSSVLIPLVAKSAPTNTSFGQCFQTLKRNRVRAFTTMKLFVEAWNHFYFAKRLIEDKGACSPELLLAAKGSAPYQKSNQFLEGFIGWQAEGNPCDWDRYLLAIMGEVNITQESFVRVLAEFGVEVVGFDSWPGFSDADFSVREDYVRKIVDYMHKVGMSASLPENGEDKNSPTEWETRKADPEAEALVVVAHERIGKFHMLSAEAVKSSAWFISHTSILNALFPGETRVTWQPDAFLSFVATLSMVSDKKIAAVSAFETILWGIAQSGLSVISDKMVAGVFGGAIDQATIGLLDERKLYDSTLAKKYGEPLDVLLKRVKPIHLLDVAVRLENEMFVEQGKALERAEALREGAEKRAQIAEAELDKLAKFRSRHLQKNAKKRRR